MTFPAAPGCQQSGTMGASWNLLKVRLTKNCWFWTDEVWIHTDFSSIDFFRISYLSRFQRNETLSFCKEEKSNPSCPPCFSCHGFPWPEFGLQVTFHTGLTRVALQRCPALPVLLALLCYRSADPCKQLLCKVGFIAAATGLQSAARFYSGALLQVTHPVTQPPFALCRSSVWEYVTVNVEVLLSVTRPQMTPFWGGLFLSSHFFLSSDKKRLARHPNGERESLKSYCSYNTWQKVGMI